MVSSSPRGVMLPTLVKLGSAPLRNSTCAIIMGAEKMWPVFLWRVFLWCGLLYSKRGERERERERERQRERAKRREQKREGEEKRSGVESRGEERRETEA
jgi:hypothetical protein